MSLKGKEVEITIDHWYSEENGMGTRFLNGKVIAETDKALLISFYDGQEKWIPKSAMIVEEA